MKELTIEQKAQRYDKALAKARTIVNSINVGLIGKDSFEAVFPELKENKEEGADEKVRKALIKLVTNHASMDLFIEYDIHLDEALSWLEKQGEPIEINPTEFDTRLQALIGKFDSLPKEELIGSLNFWLNVVQNDGTYQAPDEIIEECYQDNADHIIDIVTEQEKPTDKIEPKFNFKDGQWIVATGKCTYLITKIDGFNVTLVNTNGDEYVFDTSSLDDAHEWTIQDAKRGDILEFEDHERVVIGIVSFVNEKTGKIDVSCLLEDNKFKIGNFYALDTINPHPATKEQHDLLFRKMKEAGYKWNAERKELKKIDTYCQENCKGFQETGRCFADGECKAHKEHIKQSLQDNNFHRESAGWSEDDDKHCDRILKELREQKQRPVNAPYIELIDSDIDWLKSIKYSVQPQPKQEWSKDDEEIVEALNDYIKNLDILFSEIKIGDKDILSKEFREKVQLWLESLRPQSQWRPSRDQMNALDIAIRCGIQLGSWEEKALKSLREQLFKL